MRAGRIASSAGRSAGSGHTYGLLTRLRQLLAGARFEETRGRPSDQRGHVGQIRVYDEEICELLHQLDESQRFLIGSGAETSGDD